MALVASATRVVVPTDCEVDETGLLVEKKQDAVSVSQAETQPMTHQYQSVYILMWSELMPWWLQYKVFDNPTVSSQSTITDWPYKKRHDLGRS